MNVPLQFSTTRAHRHARTTPGPRQIVICDLNPILAAGIQQLLQGNSVLSEYVTTIQKSHDFRVLDEISPDVLIIDPWQSVQPRESVLDLFPQFPQSTAVICYCPKITLAEAKALRRLGFRAIVPKTMPGEDLLRIVCAVAFGGSYLPEIDALLQSEPEEVAAKSGADLSVLSEREIDVLREVALGKSMKEIATNLHISIKTVDTYKTRATQKLDLHSRADIVQYAIQSGWMI